MKHSYTELISRLREIEASSPHLSVRSLGGFRAQNGEYELFRADLGAAPRGAISVCISAGIHGDEPAGPEAALRFLEQNAHNEELLSKFSFAVFPCDNPSGYELGTRENSSGIDLNRQFNTAGPAAEAKILSDEMEGEQFRHLYDLHEDVDSYGLYLYELSTDSSDRAGAEIIRTVSEAGYPINLSECIEGLDSHCGVIAPSVSRMRRRKLPRAVHMFRSGVPHVITTETPGTALPLEDRVKIHLMGLDVALRRAEEREIVREGAMSGFPGQGVHPKFMTT